MSKVIAKRVIKRYRRVRKAPLRFQNPYRSTGMIYPPLPPMTTILDLPAPVDMDSPVFFKSVEARDKALSIQRQIERAKSHTLASKDAWIKQAAEELEKKKKEKLLEKQKEAWALAIDEGGIPMEFREELVDYYDAHPDVFQKKLDAISRAQEQGRTVYTPSIFTIEGRGMRKTRRRNTIPVGWQATPIYAMLRPHHIEPEPDTPAEQVEQQQSEQYERQAAFKARYFNRYGINPSHDETNRAMPKSASPLTLTALNIAKIMQTPYNAF